MTRFCARFSAITVSFGAVRFAFSHRRTFPHFRRRRASFSSCFAPHPPSFSSCFADGTYSIFIFIFINDSFEGKSANKNRLRTVSGARGGQSAVPLLICRFIPVTQARVGTAAAHGRTAGSFRSIAFSIREPLCPKTLRHFPGQSLYFIILPPTAFVNLFFTISENIGKLLAGFAESAEKHTVHQSEKRV